MARPDAGTDEGGLLMRLGTRISSGFIPITLAVLDFFRATLQGPSTGSPASFAERVDVRAVLG